MRDLQLSVHPKIKQHSRNDTFGRSERTMKWTCFHSIKHVHAANVLHSLLMAAEKASSKLHLLSKNRELPLRIWEAGAQTMAGQ